MSLARLFPRVSPSKFTSASSASSAKSACRRITRGLAGVARVATMGTILGGLGTVGALGTGVVALGATTSLVGCGGGTSSKTANVVAHPMPENETWTGVYFHPIYGYLHLMEEGTSVVGRWKRTDQSRWGELSGTKTDNVLHYTWKEYTIGMVGPASTTHGKGYFVYKMDKEDRPIVEGQFGLNDDEVGNDWNMIKQARMAPDLKSIGGDAEGVKPSGF